MADPSPIQECSTCGALIETGAEEPLALIHCPNCGAAMRVKRMFDHFEIQEVLGAGGMGAVYRALDTKLNRPVALKVLRSEHMDSVELIESLTKEAAITASINHPHVVKVFSTGTAHGNFYIAMELVDKGSLDDLMTLQGKVPEAQVLEVGIQIAQGLQAAFQRGLIHRDVKPGNILFADAHRSKITDFGLAILQDHVDTVAGDIWGTPYYVAPEKLETPPQEDFRSDIYSLGATLFHALAGRPPFEAETASMVALKHLKSQAVSLQSFAPEVSGATTFVINKALSKDPDQRYPSYEAFIESLQYAHDQCVEKARHPQQKRQLVVGGDDEEAMSWITFAMVALIVLSGVLAFVFRDRLFPRATTPPAVAAAGATTPKEMPSTVESQFEAARSLLVRGKTAEGAAALRALHEKAALPQPLQHWVRMNAALAFFLLGQPDAARAELQTIEAGGLFSQDPLEEKTARFFLDLATAAGTAQPQPAAAAAAKYDPASYESFALLLLAAKNWSHRAFDQAGPLFLQFRDSSPPENHRWIAELKPVAEPFLADYAAWQPAAESARLADTPEKQAAALQTLRTARGQLKQRGKLIEEFDREEGRLEKLLRVHEEKMQEEKTAAEQADARTLTALKQQVIAKCAQYRFVEANRHVAECKVNSEKGRLAREHWLRATDALARFKATLINDINGKGYGQAVLKKNNTSLPAGKLQASDAKLDVVSGFGSVSAGWSEIDPKGVVTIAATFMRNEPPATLAPRQWQLGIFLLQTGAKEQGTALLELAAKTKPELQEAVPGMKEIFEAL